MTFLDFHKLQEQQPGHITTDKNYGHNYIESYYSEKFTSLKDEPIKLLEIGTYRFGSLILFRDWFTSAQIVGIEANPLVYDPSEEDFVYISQTPKYLEYFDKSNYSDTIVKDCDFYMLDAYCQETLDRFEDNSFDFIIDDGSHLLEHQEYAIKNWLKKVKPGGILLIEDVQKLEHCVYFDSFIYEEECTKTTIDLRELRKDVSPDTILYEIKKH
jgi:SAM-dependent methyltransferase